MEKKARILCLQQSTIFENYGGAEYYLDDLLTASSRLLGSGNVKTIVPKRTDHFKLENRPYSVEVIPFKQSGIFKKLQNRYSWDFFWTAYNNALEFAPTYLLCAHVSLAPMTYAISKLTGIPYFVIALGIETWGDLYPQDEYSLRKANGIVSISEWTKTVLVRRGYDSNKISVVHPTLNEFYEKIPLPNRTLNLADPLRLLTISRLSSSEQYKGQDHVLEALSKIRKTHPTWNIEYTIQGEGSDRNRLKSLTKKLDLDSWVKFKDKVPSREELVEIYKNADIFIMPSRFGKWDGSWKGEGFGIVYVEAGVFGVPSIAYDCGGATDIIQNEKTGVLVEPENTEKLADSIMRFYKNRELVLEMGKLAHSEAKEKFSPTSMAKQLTTFFKQTYA